MTIDLRKILGLGLTLQEYEEHVLGGETPYFEQADLIFECTHCGQCCSRPGVVYLTDADMEKMSDHFDLPIREVQTRWLTEDYDGEWMIEVERGRDCPFFIEERCAIHAVKPQQCQTYPFWPEIVGTQESWEDEREHCPGIDRGAWYSAEQVRRLLLGLDRTP